MVAVARFVEERVSQTVVVLLLVRKLVVRSGGYVVLEVSVDLQVINPYAVDLLVSLDPPVVRDVIFVVVLFVLLLVALVVLRFVGLLV